MDLQDFCVYKAVFFDLDGTLWSPLNLSLASWHKAGKVFGVQTDHLRKEKLALYMGSTTEVLARGLFPDVSPSILGEMAALAMKLEIPLISEGKGDIYPGVLEVIPRLAEEKRLFVVSNCQVDYIEHFLTHYNINTYIEGHLSMGDTGQEKHKNILAVMKRHNISEGVFVGDTQIDCDAAHANGLAFVYAGYGFGRVKGYDAIAHSFYDLLKLL
ncbi:MAG: HAD hydrolase-like protein [Bacteroidales bacterium]|jgi:phosphoglycolate phosphatase|nr:HAD hydrolase-like protein [Bacteroidales bacterium]